ncbi:MAG: molybdopterin-dependent oxidoreductase [Anaerolineae bacterium]|jgi:DMSO/TMAO reductase YedYZ molybdopterin-dependent catalytic subunit|nr:molybdopterin-dependent oxidoreductase [Anaerolineae bacterium]
MPPRDPSADDRLPPGQTRTEQFPVLQFGTIPQIDLATWRLRIWGEVRQPAALSWEEVCQLPVTERTLDLHCVTRWSKYDTHWRGFTLQTLLDSGWVTPLPTARFVIQHAPGYTTNLPLNQVVAENFLFATHYEGKPITPEHGFPLRGLPGAIPGRDDLKDVYLWKGAKWLNGLEFSAEDLPGYWERSGYNNEADVWKDQRFAD